jgi:hypothetical protein
MLPGTPRLSDDGSLIDEVRQRRLQFVTRRHFLRQSQLGLGALALSGFMGKGSRAKASEIPADESSTAPRPPKTATKIRSVIYLHMVGSPPQQDLFDYKPKLNQFDRQPCPDEILRSPKFSLLVGHPKLLGSPYHFEPRGQCGQMVSDLLPHTATIVDDIALIRSLTTDQFSHPPAELLLHTGINRLGGASMGSWVTYGLGSENENLPGFVVLVSGGARGPSAGKHTWASGFLPSVYQGVQCRTAGEPILFVNDPPGMSRSLRRRSLDALRQLNELELSEFGDPETVTRISQYELAYRMQTAVPKIMDISREPKHVHEAYGTQPGAMSFANNCLLARRLVEQGVRFVQLFDSGWDVHGTSKNDDLMNALPRKCREVDQPIAALIHDLKARGLFDETLVVWSGEFGRTSTNEVRVGSLLGRDHHPYCASMWMAGGGIKRGVTLGETDDIGYFVTKDEVTVRDLHATVLSLMGLDPYRLSYTVQGTERRLIGESGEGQVIRQILA